MRCIHSLETFGYAGSSITDYPRCSLQFQAQIPYQAVTLTDAASDEMIVYFHSFLVSSQID